MKTRIATQFLMALLLGALFALPCAADISQDDPNLWRTLNGPPGGSVGNISMSPFFTQDHTLYAAANHSGVYRSTDAGLTWNPIGAEYFCGA